MNKIIEAADPDKKIIAMIGDIEIEAAAAGENNPPRFSMLAYTGKPMRIAGYGAPVIVSLKGIEIPSQKIPIRLQHDPAQGVGHTTEIKADGTNLTAKGFISRDTEFARDVVNSGKNGFPWQASIGAAPIDMVFVPDGQKVKANGSTWDGPVYHISKSLLKEISFVDLGADDGTSVKIAAKQNTNINPSIGAKKMLTYQEAKDEVAPFGELFTKEEINEMVIEAQESKLDKPAFQERIIKAIHLKQIRATHVNSVTNAPSGMTMPSGVSQKDIMACCFLFAAGESRVAEKAYKPEVLNAAADLRVHSVNDICRTSLQMENRPVPASRQEMIKAAFSSGSLSNALAAGSETVIQQAFMDMTMNYRKLGSKKNVSNFKTHNLVEIVNIGGDDPELAPGGELKHAVFKDSKITHSAKTRGLVFMITRNDLINDNLGCFAQIREMIGFNAARTANVVFFNKLKNPGASFFTEARKNLLPSKALGIENLTEAVQCLREMAGDDNLPIGASPKYLTVAPFNEMLAKQLVASTEVRDTTASTKYSTANPLNGIVEVVVEPLLGTAFGGLDTTWYLSADPVIVPGLICSYLDGIETPVVETVNLDFDKLGIGLRSYMDFGADTGDFRGILKATA
jgi:phage head maturation protease